MCKIPFKKIIYKRKYNTVCAVGSGCITKANKGIRYKANQVRCLRIFAQNSNMFLQLPVLHGYKILILLAHPNQVSQNMSLLRHTFLKCGWPFGAFANSFLNSILLTSMNVTIHMTWSLPQTI